MAKKIIIEDNIPIPKKGRKLILYPFHQLLVGQSFFIRCPKTTIEKKLHIISSSGRQFSKKSGCKFVVRSMVDGVRAYGVRAWRIK